MYYFTTILKTYYFMTILKTNIINMASFFRILFVKIILITTCGR